MTATEHRLKKTAHASFDDAVCVISFTTPVPDALAPRVIVITVPIASPSLNKFTYSHWRTQHAQKAGWLMLLTNVARSAPKATGKRRLEIHRYGKRALDIDNLIGGAKCVITDNLRKLQLLRDDSPDMVEFHAENHKLAKGEAPHTVIVLRDLEG